MITNFKVSENYRIISWSHKNQTETLAFEYEVAAYHIEYLDEIIVQSDVFESGRNNLALYNADASLKARPEMPERKPRVAGVYAIWFGQGRRQVDLVLISDEFNPYQTACTFDLETYEFSDFHPTK